MARPYSNDLRARVAALLDGGYTCCEVAELLQIGVATVVRNGQRQLKTGTAGSKPMGGARHDALGEQRTWRRQRVREAPDLTLQALRAELLKRDLSVSHWTNWSFCHKEGLTFKKIVFCPASKIVRKQIGLLLKELPAKEREAFIRNAGYSDPTRG